MLIAVLRRLAAALPVLVVVLLAVFLLQEVMPGDPAAIIAGDQAGPEQIAVVRHNLGLDRPLLSRFVDFIGGVLRGDLGNSIISRRPVLSIVWQALPVTASLALVAMVLTLFLGLPLGVVAALRRGRLLDRAISGFSAVALAVPPFVVGFLLVIPLAVNRSWFPATDYAGLDDGLWPWLRHLVLPALAFALPLAAELARQVRGSLAEALEQDFIRTVRANGLRPRNVVGKHGLRNAAIPIVTVLGLQAGRLLGGAIVVESVFALPGVGSLAYQSVLSRDLPLIQGVVLISGVVIVLVNLVVDLSSSIIDPRLRS